MLVPRSGRLGIVVVIDGLRPDSIGAEDTPVLHALGQDGAVCTRGHAVVPAVTRVNAASMSTGLQPTATGITGNLLYVPEVDRGPFTTADAANLLRLREATGTIVEAPTLAEYVEAAGGTFVAIGSGSSGSTLCLNPRAPDGVGVMINGDDPTKGAPFAYPASVGDDVLARFGPPPSKGRGPTNVASVDYLTRVVADYVLDALAPDVLMIWITEPDNAQHRHGVGSVHARDAIRNADRNLGVLVDRLDQLGLTPAVNLLVVSDHGFSRSTHSVDVAAELVAAGLKGTAESCDVVVTRTGSAGLFVSSPGDVPRLVDWLQRQAWAGAVFTAADDVDAASGRGWVDGTLSRDLLGSAHPTRSPDVLVSFPWVVDCPPHVVAHGRYAGSEGSGPCAPGRSDHGNLSPADMTTTFLAWGADIARLVSPVPVGNVDVTPTMLALAGAPGPPEHFDGRVATELLEGGPPPGEVAVDRRTRTVETSDARYRAEVLTSTVDGHVYVDLARRLVDGEDEAARRPAEPGPRL